MTIWSAGAGAPARRIRRRWRCPAPDRAARRPCGRAPCCSSRRRFSCRRSLPWHGSKADAYARIRSMKKLSLALAGGVAALALLAGLATVFPFAAIFLQVALESLRPQVIGWEAQNAWAKCAGAIGGTGELPSET